jgi:hypothetical protein
MLMAPRTRKRKRDFLESFEQLGIHFARPTMDYRGIFQPHQVTGRKERRGKEIGHRE